MGCVVGSRDRTQAQTVCYLQVAGLVALADLSVPSYWQSRVLADDRSSFSLSLSSLSCEPASPSCYISKHQCYFCFVSISETD